MSKIVLCYTAEEVGQLLAKHHGKFARVFSFMRGLLRSEHLCGTKEIWKLSKDKSVRLQYFKKIARYILIVAIRIMTRLLQTIGEKNLHYTEHRGSYFETGRP